jgi:hypothetical protein
MVSPFAAEYFGHDGKPVTLGFPVFINCSNELAIFIANFRGLSPPPECDNCLSVL